MSEIGTARSFFTIGAYGFTAETFFGALQAAAIDTFCDIRWRRAVRGTEYVFVNSARLQRRLGELAIRYLHFRDLAPTPALRRAQYEADKAEGKTKRQRTLLSEAFIEGYRREYLAKFDSKAFLERLGPGAGRVVLFCVEREPAACHRSLLAARVEQDLGIQVIHLIPQQASS